ncbi:MAG: 2,3-diphosphoglycerate-dependent phosphoglycerate mutase [Olsenella profusa]
MRSATLVVMRHGESTWTDKAQNRFAGWADIPLTERGRDQARHAGELIRDASIRPDAAFTSLLRRSIETCDIVLDVVDRLWVPVIRSWRLNERHYGSFQGEARPAMRERYGEELFTTYRRSYDVRPPEIATSSPWWQGDDPRYGVIAQDGLDSLDPAQIRSECLRDVVVRLEPFWQAFVTPCLSLGETVLVVTHGSVVRSLIKVIEGLSDEEIRTVNVPTGVPRAYEFTSDAFGGLRVQGSGRYLDPEAAAAGIAETKELGKA